MDIQTKREMHQKVFLSKSEYIPLTVKVAKPQVALAQNSDNTNYDVMMNPAKVLEKFMDMNANSIKVESDWIPVLESNFLESLIPSLFGAEIYRSTGGWIDIKAFIHNISDTKKMEVKDIYGGQMEHALKHIEYLLNHRIEDVEVLMSRFASPLDYAVMMRGGDFYLDLLLEPELSKQFMINIMEVTIKVINIFKGKLKEKANEQITLRGLHFPGIRLTGDAVVNLSPDMIREYMFPIYEGFAEKFESVMLHYCCLPAPSGHVLPTLVDCSAIRCVDNWQGYSTFFNKDGAGMDQEKICICTDLSAESVLNVDKIMTERSFFSKVKRKEGRGLTVAVYAASIDEGRKLYDTWHNWFLRKGMV